MDSLTQFTFGAAITAAVLGPKLGVRKSLILGGVLGTMPDLDTFFPFDNPVDSFVLHRGPTHSLVVQSVLAPLLGWLLAQWLKLALPRAILAVWLTWTTHALLDAMTIYGTQLFWPLSKEPLGLGSLFIIDPLYTLPLLVLMIWGLFLSTWSVRFYRACIAALVISTAYAGWSAVAQNLAKSAAEAWLSDKGIQADQVLATPTPLNTFFWKAIAITGDSYINLYIPLLNARDGVEAYQHQRVDALGACALGMNEGARLEAFADGYVKALQRDGNVIVSDLRMGVTPGYVFNFAIADQAGDELSAPIRFSTATRAAENDWQWLLGGITGNPGIRFAEQDHHVKGTTELAAAPACPAG